MDHGYFANHASCDGTFPKRKLQIRDTCNINIWLYMAIALQLTIGRQNSQKHHSYIYMSWKLNKYKLWLHICTNEQN